MSLALGAIQSRYRASTVTLIAVALVWLTLCFPLYWAEPFEFVAPLLENGRFWVRLFRDALTVSLFGFLVWLLSVKVAIHDEGISYRSLFGRTQMRWNQIEQVRYRETRWWLPHAPLVYTAGPYYALALVDSLGGKISLGSDIERIEALAGEVISRVREPLLQKLLSLYNSGVELDFGVVRVSRAQGIKLGANSASTLIPWDQLDAYRIEEGKLYLRWQESARTIRLPLRQVPNAFGLVDLLDTIFSPALPGDRSFVPGAPLR